MSLKVKDENKKPQLLLWLWGRKLPPPGSSPGTWSDPEGSSNLRHRHLHHTPERAAAFKRDFTHDPFKVKAAQTEQDVWSSSIRPEEAQR